jgi:hypothetical protein
MSRRPLFLLQMGCLSLLAACSGDDPKPAPAGGTTVAAASSAAAAPSGSATAASSAAPAQPAADFAVVAQAEGGISLYPLKGAAFVDAGGFFARLGDGPFRQDPALTKGLLKSMTGSFYGIFPSGAWFFADSVTSGPSSYRWIKEQWGPVELLRENERILDVAAWDDDRAVAAIAMPSNDIRFFLVGGKPGPTMPAPTGVKREDAADGETTENDTSCKVKMSPSSAYRMWGLPTGHLFAAGSECKEGGGGGPLVERWEPKKVRGTIEALPAGEGGSVKVQGVVARAPDDAYVWGSAGSAVYLVHFDGKAWAAEKAPFAEAPATITASDDGTLWAAGPAGVWKQPAGGAWTQLSLPSPASGAKLTPTAAWAKSATEVWVTAKAGTTGYLLTQKAEGPAVTLPGRTAMTQSLQSNRRWLASPVCTRPYALIATVGKKGDKISGDFPAIREVFAGKPEIAGVKLILENDGASYYVGAQAPSVDAAKKLVELYLAKNPKAAAAVFCHEPIIVEREIVMQ